MRVSSAVTAALLPGYTFDRWFRPTEPTPAALARLSALYERYHMRVSRLELQYGYTSTLMNEETGQSLLPRSLIDFRAGERWRRQVYADPVYLSEVVDVDERVKDSIEQRVELYRWRMMVPFLIHQDAAHGEVNQSLMFDALPPTLKRLQLEHSHDQPLCAGDLPSSLTHLQLGRCFNQPLLACHLPSSLTHIEFHYNFNQPLPPGVLPPSLLELELGWKFDQPLQPGSLPAGLRRLTMRGVFNQPISPGVVPPSLTHLHLGQGYNRPLEFGSLPAGLVQLYFGTGYNHPLTAGVLPSSLRELHFIRHSLFNHSILPGQLPDGLESLVLPRNYDHEVGVGVLPDGLLVLDLGAVYFSDAWIGQRWETISHPHGWLPRGLRWLKIRERDHRGLQSVLPPTVQYCWHDEERYDDEDEDDGTDDDGSDGDDDVW
jgi:hypothetical protein